MNDLPTQQGHPFTPIEPPSEESGVSGTLGSAPDNIPDNSPDSPKEDELLLSTSEAATLAGVDSRTIRRWFSSGKIRGKLDGHKLSVYSADVLKMSGTAPGTVEDFSPSDPGQKTDLSGTEVVDIEVSPSKENEPQPEDSRERERLMVIIESQAHQLKAAGDVIVYLRSQLEEKDQEIKLLTCSDPPVGWWSRFSKWFMGKQ